MEKENKILVISKVFAIRIIRLYQHLVEEKHEYVLSKQVLRSGTSIGANVRESVNAQSKLDFINKLNIALKESNETEYWLELLHETDYIDDQSFNSIIQDNNNITGTLVNIIKRTKDNLNN
ncbi:MAG: four helix bundle protein [Bacteroidaceae bacterium]|nr:four helix bundle protein [Bacteroidaceae bacterium]